MRDEENKRTRTAIAVTLVSLLPLLYLLSYGPMFRFYMGSNSDTFDFFFELLYLPIDLLYGYFPGFDAMIDWYEEVWDA